MISSLLCFSFSYVGVLSRIVYCVLLLPAAVSDAKYRRIPVSLQKACVVFAVAGSFDPNPGVFLMRAAGSIFCFLFLFTIYLISHGRGFGGADVKIISLSVLVFGFFDALESLLFGCSLGLFFEIVRPRPPNTKSDGIPVITFFVVGTILNHIFI